MPFFRYRISDHIRISFIRPGILSRTIIGCPDIRSYAEFYIQISAGYKNRSDFWSNTRMQYLDLVGVGAGSLYGVRLLVEDLRVRFTEDRRNGDPGHAEVS